MQVEKVVLKNQRQQNNQVINDIVIIIRLRSPQLYHVKARIIRDMYSDEVLETTYEMPTFPEEEPFFYANAINQKTELFDTWMKGLLQEIADN